MPQRNFSGDEIRVEVTGIWPDGTTRTRVSDPITTVWPGDFGERTLVIEGTPAAHNVLRASISGSWPQGTRVSYSWFADRALISEWHTVHLTAAHYAKNITVKVTARYEGYATGEYVSDPVLVGKAYVEPSYGLSFTALPQVGVPVSAPVDLQEGWSHTFQWLTDGLPVPGATTTTYTPTPADVGKKLTMRATGIHPAYHPKTSIFGPGDYPVLKGFWAVRTPPAITGTAKVGSTLTASNGSWPSGTTFKYQWYRGTTAITGATAKTYKPVAADLGKRLKVRVSGSSPAYHPVSAYTAYTGTIAAGSIILGTPVIKGTTTVGYTLSSSVTGYVSGMTLKRQWYRSGSAISGATGSSYRLTAADRGKRLTVRVTASRPGYTTVSKTSLATNTIK